jgi:hypothetical protein
MPSRPVFVVRGDELAWNGRRSEHERGGNSSMESSNRDWLGIESSSSDEHCKNRVLTMTCGLNGLESRYNERRRANDITEFFRLLYTMT